MIGYWISWARIGLATVEPVAKVLAHEHLLKSHAAVELDHFAQSSSAFEPFAVENDRGAFAAQNLEGLLLVTFGILAGPARGSAGVASRSGRSDRRSSR